MKEEFTTNARRWYDKDPVLSSAMKTLEESDDELLEEQKKNLLFTILEVKERRIIRVKLESSDILEDEELTSSDNLSDLMDTYDDDEEKHDN